MVKLFQHGRGQGFQAVDVIQIEPLELDALHPGLGPCAELIGDLPGGAGGHTPFMHLGRKAQEGMVNGLRWLSTELDKLANQFTAADKGEQPPAEKSPTE